MPNPYFKFKQFTVCHDRCAMKVGTDGVLVGAWAELPEEGRVLDLGTGTGLIALMATQRCQAPVCGIDVDEAAVEQALENVAASPWADRIRIWKQDVREMRAETDGVFDAIVSNLLILRRRCCALTGKGMRPAIRTDWILTNCLKRYAAC